MDNYQFTLDVFEGPLDLLLHLIEKHKIDIYDIPIGRITEQYMAYLDNWTHFDIHYSSEFIRMAATLLQIKSRMLLPKAPPPEEEDPRDDLVQQLVEFKAVKQLTEWLATQVNMERQSFSRLEELSVLGTEVVYAIPVNQLYTVFQEALARAVTHVTVDKKEQVSVEPDPYRLEDVMAQIQESLRVEEKLSFFELLVSMKTRNGMVTAFMAVLELCKQQVVVIMEEEQQIWLSLGEAQYE